MRHRLRQLRVDRPPLAPAALAKLVVYYEGVPAETACFSRDAALLREIQRLTDERIGLLRELGAALDAV